MLHVIRDWKLPVFGLNVPPGVIRRLSAAAMDNATAADPVAALSAQDRSALPARIIEPAPEQLAFLREVMGSHPGRAKSPAADDRPGDKANGNLRDKAVDLSTVDARREARFLLIQSVWDSAMAEQAVAARRATGKSVAVLAGVAHVEGGLGIARRIRVLDPGAVLLLVSPWRGAVSGDGADDGLGVGFGDGFDKAAADVRFYCPESFESRMGMTLFSRPFGADFEYVVGAVVRGSRAEAAGLRPGDVVLYAGGYRLVSLSVLHLAGSDAYREKKSLVFEVRRGQERYSVDFGPLGQQQVAQPGQESAKQAGQTDAQAARQPEQKNGQQPLAQKGQQPATQTVAPTGKP